VLTALLECFSTKRGGAENLRFVLFFSHILASDLLGYLRTACPSVVSR